ncbi:sensor domain-containing diguanylate cyclase [Rhodoferax koreense]|nr:diguanylate cyclase [Rhodoferax koreense]
MLISKKLRRFAQILVVGNMAILALLVLTVTSALLSSHEAYFLRVRHTVQNLAGTLSLGVSAEVRQVDNALLSAVQQLNRLDALWRVDPVLTQQIVDELKAQVPQVDALRLTDERGFVLGAQGAAAIFVGDRDYFRQARERPDRLVISEPIEGRTSKRWGIVLARARVAADGSFKGVVYATMSSAHFVDGFDDYALGSQGAVTLRSASLRLIARFSAGDPAPQSGFGTVNVSAELSGALAAHPQEGFFVSHTALDGIERASAYQRVPGYPLLLLVGLGTDDFYAPWRRQAAELVSLAAALAFLVVSLSAFLYQRHALQLRNQRELTRLAGEREALLQSGIVAMAKLKDRTVLWHNQALGDTFGYGAGELLGQPIRMLYPDEASYQKVGLAYKQLSEGCQYRMQLQMARKDGRLIWVDLSGSPLTNGESLWMMVDITAVKDGETQARHMAMHDPLTGLANRAYLAQDLGYALRDAERNSRGLAVCYLDLDGFKAINDLHGHEAGDRVLIEMARRMVACVRANDLVARIGGDEFVIVLSDLDGIEQLHIALRRLLEALGLPLGLGDGTQACVGASIGVSIHPEHGSEAESLIRLADQAMYVAKRGGKNRFSVHDGRQPERSVAG